MKLEIGETFGLVMGVQKLYMKEKGEQVWEANVTSEMIEERLVGMRRENEELVRRRDGLRRAVGM